MKRLILIVIVAFFAMGRLSSDSLPALANYAGIRTAVVSDAGAQGAALAASRPARWGGVLMAGIASIETFLPASEPVSLLLLGSGLISAGVLIRRRILHKQ